MTPPTNDLPDLTGTWTCAQMTTGRSKAAGIGKMVTRTRLGSRLDVAQDGDALTVTWRVLDMAIDSGTKLARVEVSQNLVEAMEVLDRPARLLSGADGVKLEMGWAHSTIGAKLGADDPLPTEADDPRVLDSDADGEPGITIRFRGLARGELYAVQRTKTRLLSRPIAEARPERVRGGVEWRLEQSVLGANNPLLKLAPEVNPVDDPSESWFVMERADPGVSDDAARRCIERVFAAS